MSNVTRFPGRISPQEILDLAKDAIGPNDHVVVIILSDELGIQFLCTDLKIGDHCYLLKEHELRVDRMFDVDCDGDPEAG